MKRKRKKDRKKSAVFYSVELLNVGCLVKMKEKVVL